jgi:hypothetical protein
MPYLKTLALLIVVLFSSFAAQAQKFTNADAERLIGMVERGETENSFWFLADLYRRHGVFVPENGTWELTLKVQDHKEIINRYNNGSVSITISRMMSPDEAAGYWQNWSDVLTEGKFDHKTFFTDDRERHLMANFNVLVLSAHELGHYLDFVYKMSDRYYSGVLTDADPLNCTESYADRFAVATINELAADSRFAAIRNRYVQLITSFNASIPEANRYDLQPKDMSTRQCGDIDLLKNGVNADGSVNQNFFRQYSSAYFNRHRSMLGDREFGGLETMLERDLLGPFFKRLEPAAIPFKLTTVRDLSIKPENDLFLGGDELREAIDFDRALEELAPDRSEPVEKAHALREMLIGPKGEPVVIAVNWTSKRKVVETEEFLFAGSSLRIGFERPGSLPETVDVRIPEQLRATYNISSALIPTDAELVLVLTPFDMEKRYPHLVVLRAVKKNEKWTADLKRLTVPGVKDSGELASWFATPKGEVWFTRAQKNADGLITITPYSFDRFSYSARQAGKPRSIFAPDRSSSQSLKGGLWRNYRWDSVFGNGSPQLFVAGYEENLQLYNDTNLFAVSETPRLLLGHLNGFRDGSDVRTAQVNGILNPRFIDAHTVRFIDSSGGNAVIRELRFAAAP